MGAPRLHQLQGQALAPPLFGSPSPPPPPPPPGGGAPPPPPPPPPPSLVLPKHPPRPSPLRASASESTNGRPEGISFSPEPILKKRTSRAAPLRLRGGPPPPAPAPPPPPPKRVSVPTPQAAPPVPVGKAMLFAKKVKSVKDKQRTVPSQPVHFARYESCKDIRDGSPPMAMAPPPPPPPSAGVNVRGKDKH